MEDYRILSNSTEEEPHSHIPPSVLPVLFMFVALVLGVLSKHLINRAHTTLPYSVVIFMLGICIGLGNATLYNDGSQDPLVLSINQWSNIHPGLFLAALLPPLLFNDATEINYPLLKKGIWQVLWLAFPGVIAGSFLLGGLFYATLPAFSNDFFLCVTLGSILSATDPVAVVSLLDSVGASPRLNIHIVGESLFNDGSAMVMYNIFGAIYFYEHGLLGGEKYTFATGLAKFLQMAVGGALIGLCFSMMLYGWVWSLNHRLEKQDLMMQLVLSLCAPYLCFFVSEELAGASGALAVVVLGIVVAGGLLPMYINRESVELVFTTVGYAATTIIFMLGGILWGASLLEQDRVGHIEAADIGYMIMIYVFIIIGRVVVIFGSYPVLANIGMGTSIKNAIFMVHAGLRGSIGIALAISLDLSIQNSHESTPTTRRQGTLVLFYTGGMTLLTLIINGLSLGPMLEQLGLGSSSEGHEAILKIAHNRLVECAHNTFAQYQKEHKIASMVDTELLHCLVPDLATPVDELFMHITNHEKNQDKNEAIEAGMERVPLKELSGRSFRGRKTKKGEQEVEDNDTVSKLRLGILRETFLNAVRKVYWAQIRQGLLEEDSNSAHILLQSVDLDLFAVSNRKMKMDDWAKVEVIGQSYSLVLVETAVEGINACFESCKKEEESKEVREKVKEHKDHKKQMKRKKVKPAARIEHMKKVDQVYTALLFIAGHMKVQEEFKQLEGVYGKEKEVEIILEESRHQVNGAKRVLENSSAGMIRFVLTHMAAHVVLSSQADVIEEAEEEGIITELEAQNFYKDITAQILHLKQSKSKTAFDPKLLEAHPEMHEALCKALDMEVEDEKLDVCVN